MDNQPRYQLIFTGTYGQASDPGIVAWMFDATQETLTPLGGTVGVANASFLEVDEVHHRLYAVSETSHGEVVSFAIEGSTGKLTETSRQRTQGASPCYLSLLQAGRYLAVTNYMGGNMAFLPVQADGTLHPPAQVEKYSGHSVHPLRQEAPHPHSVSPDPDSVFALACDLGVDKVYVYRFDEQEGKWSLHGETMTAPGSGPRHIAFHPQLSIVYVVQELASAISIYAWDRREGCLHLLAQVSTLPEGYTGDTTAADIHVSQDGRFVYASNRGHDSVVTFTVHEDGTLGRVAHTSSEGRTPRNFLLTADGRHMLVANQDSDVIVVMGIGSDGVPKPTGQTAVVSKPVCLRAVAVTPLL